MPVRHEKAITRVLAGRREQSMAVKGTRGLVARIANCIRAEKDVPGVLEALRAMSRRGKVRLEYDGAGRLREVCLLPSRTH